MPTEQHKPQRMVIAPLERNTRVESRTTREQELRAHIINQPFEVQPLAALGAHLLVHADVKQAEHCFQSALRLEPGHGPSALGLALIHHVNTGEVAHLADFHPHDVCDGPMTAATQRLIRSAEQAADHRGNTASIPEWISSIATNISANQRAMALGEEAPGPPLGRQQELEDLHAAVMNMNGGAVVLIATEGMNNRSVAEDLVARTCCLRPGDNVWRMEGPLVSHTRQPGELLKWLREAAEAGHRFSTRSLASSSGNSRPRTWRISSAAAG